MRNMAPKQHLRIHVPHYYRCPISLDLMRDPVILSTGQTYDRSSIEKWLADGNLSCPVTRQPLQDLTLIPNHMLLRLIQTWCVANKSLGVERIPTPKQPANPQQVASLAQDITSNTSRLEKVDALRRLGSLAKESDKNRHLISEMGVVPKLVSAIFCKEESAELLNQITEEALGVLALLPLSGKSINELAQEPKLRFLSHLLTNGSIELSMNVGSLVEVLTSSEEASDELRSLVGTTQGMVEGLVHLLQQTNYPRAIKVGIRSLFSICLCKTNLEKAATAGVASALLECLLRLDKGDVERALATMELLCKTAGGCVEVANHALAVPVLKKMILKVSNQASENAAGILHAICGQSEEVQHEAVEAGIFTQLLLLLQSECTCRAKKKARSLLKILRDNWPDHPCIRVLGRTDVVPF
eukprot:c2507_g1_i1 orf=451-1692(-)